MKCICKLKNNKTGGSDGLVGELLKYGGSGMVYLLEHLFRVVWHEVLLDGEKSNMFSVEQGVAQGCSLSPILFVEGSRRGRRRSAAL